MGTALVTGATSGIGLELTWQLAAAHHDLVLVARTAASLEELAERLRQLAGVQVQVIAADLSEPIGIEVVAQRLRVGRPAARRVASRTGIGAATSRTGTGAGTSRAGTSRTSTGTPVSQRPVDLLVNNAGFAVGQRFVGGDVEQERRALEVMVRAVMELTHAALPGMVERGHGAVLNVSSATALTAMGTYAAHKAWVRTFTEGLASELRGTGVSATVVNPGLTHSDFHARAQMDEKAWPEIAWLDAEDVAREALAAVRRGQVICTPSLRYLAVNAALRLSPRWLVRRVAGHASVRNQY